MGSVGRIGDDLVVRGSAPMQIVRPDARRARLVRLRVWLASALWFPVLAANLIAIALGITLPFLDEILGDEPRLPVELSAVETLLGGLAAGMITFTGIVFSAVLVADQLETTSYSPRLAARLRRDPVVIAGLALPTATASYSLFALAAVGRQANRSGEEIASALTVGLALVLVFLTFAGFVTLVQRTLDSAQIGGILRTVLRRTHRVIRDVHPIGAGTGDLPRAVSVGERAVEVSHPGPPGVLAAVDRGALVRVARQSDAFVEVVPLVGQYISPGTLVLRLHGGEGPPEEGLARRVLVLARQRTTDQDPAFGLRMLVDIAIRALSASINDPTTAVQALDRIETILIELHRRRPGPTIVADLEGEPRGLVHAPTWEQYLSLALTEVRQYGASSIQVARRLRVVYEHLLEIVDESERPQVELEQRLFDQQLVGNFPDRDEREMVCRPDRLGLGGAA
jgi:uncharacterized membrane protein